MPNDRRSFTDLARAWLAATLLSGLPSTLWAFATGGDPLEAARAAGQMLLPGETSTAKLVAAATLVHPVEWALLAAVLIGLLDLKVIAPAFFPAVAALDFRPQMADHLMWGATYAIALDWRRRL